MITNLRKMEHVTNVLTGPIGTTAGKNGFSTARAMISPSVNGPNVLTEQEMARLSWQSLCSLSHGNHGGCLVRSQLLATFVP